MKVINNALLIKMIQYGSKKSNIEYKPSLLGNLDIEIVFSASINLFSITLPLNLIQLF